MAAMSSVTTTSVCAMRRPVKKLISSVSGSCPTSPPSMSGENSSSSAFCSRDLASLIFSCDLMLLRGIASGRSLPITR